MMTATASPSTPRIVFCASMFLFSVPLLTALMGGIASWAVFAQFDHPTHAPHLPALGFGLSMLIPGFFGGLAAFLMAAVDGIRLHRIRVWTSALAGFLGSATAMQLAFSKGSWDAAGLATIAIGAVLPTLAALLTAAWLRRV